MLRWYIHKMALVKNKMELRAMHIDYDRRAIIIIIIIIIP